MKTCEYAGEPLDRPRSHPWTDATTSSAFRYYDFKTEPALIRTVLEDFVPWSHYPAVTRLYELLERLNASSSILESNDCAFSAPHESEAPELGKALQCDGRVMILYRDLALNLSRRRVEDLKNALHFGLATLEPDLEFGMIGTTIPPVRYIDLPVARAQQLGYQLMISFWAWGDSEQEVMSNLERVLENLAHALEESMRLPNQVTEPNA
jgi:hypothetical protein